MEYFKPNMIILAIKASKIARQLDKLEKEYNKTGDKKLKQDAIKMLNDLIVIIKKEKDKETSAEGKAYLTTMLKSIEKSKNSIRNYKNNNNEAKI